jgi:hypothetical protein
MRCNGAAAACTIKANAGYGEHRRVVRNEPPIHYRLLTDRRLSGAGR